MSIGECELYLRGMEQRVRDDWERTRMLMYAIVQVNSERTLEPDDVLSFAWDNENDGEGEREELDEAAVAALRVRAKNMETLLHGEKPTE